MVHPPQEREAEDDDDASFDNKTVNFDKLSVRRRALMRNDWGQETKKGDLI